MNEIYEAVIGLEVHVELSTESKMFCACKNTFHAEPNSCVCPVCMGLPGSMPSLNRRAVELAIRAGLAVGCDIARHTRFDRKNYFYPDLPKAYQISQYEYPICVGGEIRIKDRTVRIERIHMEEDAGKLTHGGGMTLVDYNRCGVPLIEIVSSPDIRTGEQAREYLTELRTRLLYAAVSDCKLSEGSFRCDVNLSVRKKGDTALGVRTEMKNINSFAFVAKAIEYEFARQVEVLESGGRVVFETRRFDERDGRTHTMRVKESAADYRFFPEPDLPPLKIEAEWVREIADDLPPMPEERRARYVSEYALSEDDARILTSHPSLAAYFEGAAEQSKYPKICSNILLTELMGGSSGDVFECALTSAQLAEISVLFGDEVISSSTVKKLIALCTESGESAEALVEKYALAQISDREYLREVLNTVIAENPKLIADYRSGKSAAQKAIIGKAMAHTHGKANPKILNELFEKL